MAYVSVYLGLGSNLGNRLRNIESALTLLDSRLGTHNTSLSRVIETDSWGFKGDKFLNACVLYRIHREEDTQAQCSHILRICKEIEQDLGRPVDTTYDAEGRRIYHNRTMDIDILFYGSEHIDTETLTIPHPLIRQRPFVMLPLQEIAKPSLRAAFPEIFV